MKRIGKAYTYRDRRGEWRWRGVSSNGKKVANAGEGYGRRAHAEKMLRKYLNHAEFHFVPVVENPK